jgi:hypothetical protein
LPAHAQPPGQYSSDNLRDDYSHNSPLLRVQLYERYRYVFRSIAYFLCLYFLFALVQTASRISIKIRRIHGTSRVAGGKESREGFINLPPAFLSPWRKAQERLLDIRVKRI